MTTPVAGPPPALHRGLRRLDLVSLTVNTVVGAGVFAMPAQLAAGAGRWSLAVLVAAFVVVALIALCLVEVASRFDVTGGPPIYAAAAFGPAAGFAVGWMMGMSRILVFAAIAAVMLDYAAALWPALAAPAARAAAATLFVALLTLFNLRGVTHGARLGNLFTVAKLAPLVLLAAAGVWLAGWTQVPQAPPAGAAGLSQALLLALFACFGFELVAVLAGEARHPERDMPAGILGGVAIAGGLYVLLMLACFATLPDLAGSQRPLADVAESLAGPAGGIVIAIAAVLSCAGGLSASMLATPRMFYALAVQGDLPSAVARVHPRFRTPVPAILLVAAAAWLLTVTGTFIYLVTIFVLARMFIYGATCLSLIALRRKGGAAPVTVHGGRAIAWLAFASCVAIVATTHVAAVRDAAALLAAGFMIRAGVRLRGRRVPASAAGR